MCYRGDVIEYDLIVLAVYTNRVSRHKLAPEQALRYLVFHLVLNYSPQGPRTQRRVISLLGEVFKHVKGEALPKAQLMARLSQRMAVYASRGDTLGMEIIVGRIAANLQALKLEAEAGFERFIQIAGAFLIDVADKVLPRLLDQLLPEPPEGP